MNESSAPQRDIPPVMNPMSGGSPSGTAAIDPSQLPFMAPCRPLNVRAPMRWVRKGWADFRRAPSQSLAYGIAIVALPFVILIGLFAGREWKLLGAYGAAGFIAVLALSITGEGIAAPRWQLSPPTLALESTTS